MSEEETQIQWEDTTFGNSMKLPKVFIDGRTLVKISLVSNFINCGSYQSRSGMTFKGCLGYLDGNLNETRGIYYIKVPIFSFDSRRKISRSLSEMKEFVRRELQNISKYLGLEKTNLLINYDNYVVSIYDRFVKGRIFKFPLEGEQGHLYVSRIPWSLESDQLPYKQVMETEIYNHKIQFAKEVAKFTSINTFGGEGVFILNQHDDAVMVTLSSPDHEEETVMLKAKQLYLFTHPRPRRTGGLD